MLFKNLVCIWKVSNMNVIVHLLGAAPKNDIEMHFVIQFRLHLFRNQRLCINVQTAKHPSAIKILNIHLETNPNSSCFYLIFLKNAYC